jgi:hypothetical protein
VTRGVVALSHIPYKSPFIECQVIPCFLAVWVLAQVRSVGFIVDKVARGRDSS